MLLVYQKLLHPVNQSADVVGNFSPLNTRERKAWFRDYLDDILNKDVRDVTEIRKVDVLKAIALWLLAHSAQFFSLEELAAKAGIANVQNGLRETQG